MCPDWDQTQTFGVWIHAPIIWATEAREKAWIVDSAGESNGDNCNWWTIKQRKKRKVKQIAKIT